MFPSLNNKIVFEDGDIKAQCGKSKCTSTTVFCFAKGAVFRISAGRVLKGSPFNKSRTTSIIVNSDKLQHNLINDKFVCIWLLSSFITISPPLSARLLACDELQFFFDSATSRNHERYVTQSFVQNSRVLLTCQLWPLQELVRYLLLNALTLKHIYQHSPILYKKRSYHTCRYKVLMTNIVGSYE